MLLLRTLCGRMKTCGVCLENCCSPMYVIEMLQLQVCSLDLDWLQRNHCGSCASGDSGEGGDGDGGGGGSVEVGEERVVGLKESVGTQFCVELSSGDLLHCTLPPVYVQLLGTQ